MTLFVKEGDQITQGQTLLELENEKAVAPIPSPYYAGNGGYNHYDVNISSGGCTDGAVVVLDRPNSSPTRAVDGGSGAYGQDSPTIEFGLGDAFSWPVSIAISSFSEAIAAAIERVRAEVVGEPSLG